jgi:hypothetical protein
VTVEGGCLFDVRSECDFNLMKKMKVLELAYAMAMPLMLLSPMAEEAVKK